MPESTVYQVRITRLSILDEHGGFDEALGKDLLQPDQVLACYRWMVLSRRLDETAVALQREGRMGTYAECRGQEAAAVGSAFALEKRDWLFPAYRENGAYLLRGVPAEQILLFWMGDERANRVPEGVNNMCATIPVGTQNLPAAGAAWALKLRRTDAAVIVYFGDGGTSKGDFHEAMNFAGAFKLPIVFFCSNNSWAISVPRARQTAAETFAQKAAAYGAAGIQVDGNDLFAVYKATRDALARARRGEGPTLIEAVTYRMSNHTTADDASRYRDAAEVEMWARRCPIARVRAWLTARGHLDGVKDAAIADECRAAVADAVKKAEGIAPAPRGDIFRYVFAQMPPSLVEQMEVGSVPAPESEGAVQAYSRAAMPSAGEYLPPEPPVDAPHPLTKIKRRGRSKKGDAPKRADSGPVTG
jgi:pyruvate dehydrogenase E1 component alpha subunit